MDYIKKRWSGTSNSEVRVNQSQPIETSFNSVTFTNPHSSTQNPIIISTQHPSSISIVHEVRNPVMKATMTSPTDSYHSAASNFNHEKSQGKSNMAYTGSNGDMSNRRHRQENQTHSMHNQSPHLQNRVFHQSYWSWNWPWSGWNQREKVFLLVIVILSMCILSLTSVLSVVVQKNIQYRDLLFEKLGLQV